MLSLMLKSLTYLEPKIEIIPNADLRKFCTMHVGGRASYVIRCFDSISLVQLVSYLSLHNIKYKVIGLGANLIFSESNYEGVIVVNSADKIECMGTLISAESGATISSLITTAYIHSLSGLEGLAGIPSTLGGAITNSLASGDSSISNLVVSVECYNKKDLSKKLILKNSDCEFSYRNSIFKSNEYIITRATLKLEKSDSYTIYNKIKSASYKKLSNQPMNYASAGSIFKRANNFIPSRAIDELGLKGLTVGGASVSTKHAGFIINHGFATADDISHLIKLIRQKIHLKYKIYPSLEVEFVDN